MGETSWWIKTVVCRQADGSAVEEKIKYAVSSTPREKREKKRAAKREAGRADEALHVLARALNINFLPGRDYHLILSLDETGMERVRERSAGYENEAEEDRILRALQQETVNFIRRLQRKTEKLQYVFSCSDRERDKRTGQMIPCRPHVHMIVRGSTLELAEEKWTLGAVLEKELYYVKHDLHGLAEYLLQQTRTVEGMKRYTPSRNLDKPEEKEPVQVYRGGESLMRCPRGCEEIYRSAYIRGRNQYMRYYRPAVMPEKRGGHKRDGEAQDERRND